MPGWADAEAVVAGFTPKPGVHYTGLWFNANGLNRALAFKDKLTITGSISLTASEGFTQKNLHRSHAENVEAMRKQTALHLENGVQCTRVGVMAAFGCNYQGDISPAQVVKHARRRLAIAEETGARIEIISRSPTRWVGRRRCASSAYSARCVSRWPDMKISLHLHDTRGLAVANAHAGLKHGRDAVRFHRRRARRLPVCRSAKGRRQHLHRGTGAAVRGDGHQLPASISTR